MHQSDIDQSSESRRENLFDLAIGLAIILSVFAVYAQVNHFEFIGFDDDKWLYNNARVQEGLTPGTLKWALTAVITSNWIPVSLLSHIVDWQLFGSDSGLHHLVNVFIHAVSAVLLFVALQRATGQRWPCAFVAFIFALHPLNVGSVAWLSERKGILSAFFGFLALYAYVRYCERPSIKRYLLVVAPFCVGLLSKPMLITFPFRLLLFDIWPLRRAKWPVILWEKLPLFALSGCASALTYFVQASSGAVIRPGLRRQIANAFLSYATYLRDTFWPTHLAVFYPYPLTISMPQIVAAFVLVLAISAAAIFTWRTRPYIATGWFWFLGTLVPALGLVQVGMQSHADRYMYTPMIGISIVLAWGALDLVSKWPRTTPVFATLAAIICILCSTLSWREAAYWQDTESIFQRAIDVTPDNWVAHLHVAIDLAGKPGRAQDANPHFEAVQRINPKYAEDANNMAAQLIAHGDCATAVPQLRLAFRVNPNSAQASGNLGVCMLLAGDYQNAVPWFETAIRNKPDFAEAYFGLAQALSKIPGRTPEAIARYEELLTRQPNHARAHRSLGLLLVDAGRKPEAISHLESAQRIHPDTDTAITLDRLRAAH